MSFISDPLCQKCGAPFDFEIMEGQSCLKCLKDPPSYDHCRAIVKFDEHSKRFIHSFKYYDNAIIAKLYAKYAASRYQNMIKDADLIIPVPMYRLKRLVRLYNQAQIFAEYISQFSGVEVNNYILYKSRWTKSQTKLSESARKKNLQSSFIVKNQEAIKGKSIVLVDDVHTTGTTVSYCAKLLKKEGAGKILVICAAITVKD